MQRNDKLKMACTREELAEILRSLADSLEKSRISLNAVDLPWSDVQKVTLNIKQTADAAEVKLKIVSDSADNATEAVPLRERPAAPGRSATKLHGGYGSLKKRMKKSFKNIMYALHDQAWPDAQDIESFVLDSRAMVQYPGKGDEFYQEYSAAVAAFQASVAARDMDGATHQAHLLNDLKTRCHKLYD